MAGEEGLLGGLFAARRARLRLDPLPDLVRLERRLGPDHDQDQGDEGEKAEAELDRGEVAELHPGDDQAQEVDLGHRPRMQQLDEPEDRGLRPGEAAGMREAQNPDRADELEEGDQDRHEEDEGGEGPHPAGVECRDPFQERRRHGLAAEPHGHEREQVGHAEQGESGDVQGQCALDALPHGGGTGPRRTGCRRRPRHPAAPARGGPRRSRGRRRAWCRQRDRSCARPPRPSVGPPPRLRRRGPRGGCRRDPRPSPPRRGRRARSRARERLRGCAGRPRAGW